MIDFADLFGVDAPTRKRKADTGQIAILSGGARIGVVTRNGGSVAFINVDVAEHLKPMIREDVMRQLPQVKQVKFLPPKPVFKRARATDF